MGSKKNASAESVSKAFSSNLKGNKKLGDVPIDEMPNLQDKDVQAATVKIQSVFRGFQTRKGVDSKNKASAKSVSNAFSSNIKGKRKIENAAVDEMPNLEDKDVQAATVKIQSVFNKYIQNKELFRYFEWWL